MAREEEDGFRKKQWDRSHTVISRGDGPDGTGEVEGVGGRVKRDEGIHTEGYKSPVTEVSHEHS